MNKTNKSLLAVAALLLAMALLLTGCTKEPKEEATKAPTATEAPTTAPAADATAVPGNPDDVMATVNGKPVTRAEYEGYLATMVNYYTNQGYDTTSNEILSVLKQFAMQTAVEYAVMDQKLIDLGMELTEADIQAAKDEAKVQWETVIAEGMTYYGITDESTEEERASTLVQILADLEAQGYTEESYIAEAVEYAAYDRLQTYAAQDVKVTDEDVIEYYNSLVEADKATYENDAAAYEQTNYMNQMYAMYGMSDYMVDIWYKPNGYRAINHILLIPEDETLVTAYNELQTKFEEQQSAIEAGTEVTEELVTEEQIEVARQAILAAVQPTIDLVNEELAAGAAFNDLVLKYGQDPGMKDAQTIAEGYAVHMDSIMWDPAFTAAAFSVENAGDVAAPVVGTNGVHIVHYDHDLEGGPIEMTDDMKAFFLESLTNSAVTEAYYAALDTWVKEYNVVYSEEAQAIVGSSNITVTPAE